jgi:hypothetical protein
VLCWRGKERRPFDPSRDSPALIEAARRLPPTRLLILDSIVSAIAGDSHKNAEVRRGLQPLVDFAAETGCAVLGITHFTKGTIGREPTERVTGSQAFGALARLVMAACSGRSRSRIPAEGDHPIQWKAITEPLSKLLRGSGNLGGFRAAGRGDDKKFVVLYSSGEDTDWPDTLDLNTGQFVYYGDNKTPGHELHDTEPGGNRILRHVFQLLHRSPQDRARIPPFCVSACKFDP